MFLWSMPVTLYKSNCLEVGLLYGTQGGYRGEGMLDSCYLSHPCPSMRFLNEEPFSDTSVLAHNFKVKKQIILLLLLELMLAYNTQDKASPPSLAK